MRGLYAITRDHSKPEQIVADVKSALAGGVRIVQLRAKSMAREDIRNVAAKLRALTHEFGAALIINDDLHLAGAVDADGVHLGRDDAGIGELKEICWKKRENGSRLLVGVSCYGDIERAQVAEAMGASYVAFGSFFPSLTKPSASKISISVLREARRKVGIPVVAIGGISLENAQVLISAGAHALAVVTGLFDAPDVERKAREFQKLAWK